MGRVFSSLVRRPVQNWNIASRAEAELNRAKPAAAPRHPTTHKKLEQFQKEHPELLEAQKVKDGMLLENLENLVVEPEKFGEIVRTERSLPGDRQKHKDPDYGFAEPEVITEGRCTVRQALEFITSHQVEPKTFTAAKIARDYRLDAVQVQDVLGHFQIHMLQIPGQTTDSLPSDSVKALGTGSFLGGVIDKVKKKPEQEGSRDPSNASS